MNPSPDLSWMDALPQLLAARTGIHLEALPREKIFQQIKKMSTRMRPHQLQAAAADPNSEVSRALEEVVAVGETFFFRNPEQLEWVANRWVPQWRSTHAGPLQAWSAGTATGEEAWSLAALLHATLRDRGAQVLGTDLLQKSVDHAAAGIYGDWSVRSSAPLLYPALIREGSEYRVIPELRGSARFVRHNLLDPAPGRFDLIFCRNVLVYFSPPAAEHVREQLIDALEPGGLLVFGVMDTQVMPEGLVHAGRPELNCYQRRERDSHPPPAPRPQVQAAAGPNPVLDHVRALELIERGQTAAAERVLTQLHRDAPDYLPGILERALLYNRAGGDERAAGLMRELLERACALPESLVIPGPEDLPLAFYRASAEAFLARQRKEE